MNPSPLTMPVNGPTQTGADQRSGPSPQPRLPEHRLRLKEVLDALVADGLVVRADVERVGRAMVVSEGAMTAGVAAELAARISEECFDFLEDPVVRVAGEDIPISVSTGLETGSVPGPQLIAETAGRMLA